MDHPQLATALPIWLDGCTKIIADYWERCKYTHAPHEVLTYSEGAKYIKVWAHDSYWVDSNDHSKGIQPLGKRSRIYAFINRETGDVLKPNSTAAPHPTPRGNLFDAHNGLQHMTNHGPAYLR